MHMLREYIVVTIQPTNKKRNQAIHVGLVVESPNFAGN
jgi:hypothetical protein